jgi:hypothetical protein
MDKDVARKQRKVEGDARSVAPLAVGAIEGEIVLNLSLAEMLGYTLFMARGRVDRKPF